MAASFKMCRKFCQPLWQCINEFQHPVSCINRSISTSFQTLAGGKFRKSQGQAADSLAYGPLTDLPDWTYLDGTVPPLSRRQMNRQKKRIETATRVVTLLKEVNEAKEKSLRKQAMDVAQTNQTS